MKATPLSASVRSVTTSAALRALRNEKLVPGVLYGTGENIHFSVPAIDLRKLIYTPDFSLIELDLDGKTYRCIIKDYQIHPVTDALVHVDLLALKAGQPVKVDIPVHFTGNPEGVKSGGTIVKKLRKLRVKTTPEKLVEEFSIDITHLDLGQSVRVRDLETEDGVQIMNPGPIPMASIEIPRALKSAASAAEEEGEEGLEEGEEDAEGGDEGDSSEES